MKLNNKGFAITTILYSALILFMLLFFSLLGILSQYKNNLEKLIGSTKGARDIVTLKTPIGITSKTIVNKGGFYKITDCPAECIKYLSKNSEATCE